jgi:hypothetical protein
MKVFEAIVETDVFVEVIDYIDFLNEKGEADAKLPNLIQIENTEAGFTRFEIMYDKIDDLFTIGKIIGEFEYRLLVDDSESFSAN